MIDSQKWQTWNPRSVLVHVRMPEAFRKDQSHCRGRIWAPMNFLLWWLWLHASDEAQGAFFRETDPGG